MIKLIIKWGSKAFLTINYYNREKYSPASSQSILGTEAFDCFNSSRSLGLKCGGKPTDNRDKDTRWNQTKSNAHIMKYILSWQHQYYRNINYYHFLCALSLIAFIYFVASNQLDDPATSLIQCSFLASFHWTKLRRLAASD